MHRALLASLLFTLAACWNITPSNHDAGAGAGGEGGGSAGTCATCSEAAFVGTTLGMCQASSALFSQLQGCACDPNHCAAECTDSICGGAPADTTCKSCLGSQCASNYSNCSSDQSTH
jgi:hypothetical protein